MCLLFIWILIHFLLTHTFISLCKPVKRMKITLVKTEGRCEFMACVSTHRAWGQAGWDSNPSNDVTRVLPLLEKRYFYPLTPWPLTDIYFTATVVIWQRLLQQRHIPSHWPTFDNFTSGLPRRPQFYRYSSNCTIGQMFGAALRILKNHLKN